MTDHSAAPIVHDSSRRPRRHFRGPRCWLVSAALGALLGLGLAWAFPATPARAHTAADAQRTVVVETRPDGSQNIRRNDESTRPLSTTLVPGNERSEDGVRSEAGADAAMQSPTAAAKVAEPDVPLVLCIPFALLLLSIAVMPFVNERFWHQHYPDFAFFLGALVLAYCLGALGSYGRHEMLHAGLEYYAFIALVGGLYIVSGGILIDIRARGRPATNTALLAVGAVLANIVGTTGASVLLIGPFMRMNAGRMRPLHAVFFMFIVSNCAGCLTPIGDPPLYLGYLKGVPFFWTLQTLWPMWLAVNGTLLALFFVYDGLVRPTSNAPSQQPPSAERRPIISGWPSVAMIGLLVACVFVDPALRSRVPGSLLASLPVGATLQIALAIAAYFLAKKSIRAANQFTFAPVKEVGFLFVGIFLAMAPALGYLRAHATSFGLETPTHFYFGTGVLSAVLDNAPTYLSFLQVAFGVLHLPLNADGIARFISSTYDLVHAPGSPTVHFNGQHLLESISLGAVFFGAMTYIGNGPNFMVKSIVDSANKRGQGLGVRMPSFFGYLVLAWAILLPVLVACWLVFVR